MKTKIQQKSIKHKGKLYNVIDSYKTTDIEGYHTYIVYETDVVKTKRFWAWYPLWVGNKFRWFTWVNTEYRFYLYMKEEFELFNYTAFWGKIQSKWLIEKIQ